jgi:recombinational DNA repair protein (RecF pathway)
VIIIADHCLRYYAVSPDFRALIGIGGILRSEIMEDKCSVCGLEFDLSDLYEYRGEIACKEHFDKMCDDRDIERQEIIMESKHRTDRFKGLDLSDSQIGKANRDILKTDIKIAKKESMRRKLYERGNQGSIK